MDFKLHDLERITNNFSEEHKIGSGGLGDVYKAVYDGEEIAVKKLHQLQGLDDKSFDNEYRTLTKVNHPNVIRLIGYCHEARRKYVEYHGQIIAATVLERIICYEYMQGGSLNKYIGDNSCELDWPTCYQIIKGTCKGLNHLHNGDQKNPIFHLDLKPSSILLDNNMTAKISGFDLSRTCSTPPEEPFKTDILAGTHGYMPPEYVDSGLISSKYDIYSLGVTILKMMAGNRGPQRCHDMSHKQFIDLVSENLEKKLQETLTYSAYVIAISQVKKCVEIAIRCVNANPDKRPCIIDVVDELEGKKITKTSAEDEHKRVNGLDDLVHDASAEPINLPLAVLQDITMNFADERKIGQGGFGIVYKGVLQTGSVVAIKKLLNSQTIEEKPFYDETTSMMGVRHQNIVRFLGYCANTEYKFIKMEGSGSLQKPIYSEIRERLLCFEYMSNGGLDNHLTDELRGLEWHMRYQIIKGICEGLQYLHKKSIAHMDLKPANILLDDYMVPKITDFGVSRYLDGVSRYVTKRCLVSLGYCAPEYLFGGEVSLKADIFCLGAIIRDIVTGRKEDIDTKNVLRRWRYRWNKSAKYPPLGYQQISKCIEIAQSCMVSNPKLRPYISEIIVAQNEIEKTNEHITNVDESTVGQISPNPWELLEIDPLELTFPFKPNKQIQSSVELNNERDDYIAFDIQKPRNTLTYFIKPNKGIIPPHSRSSVTVTFQASEREPGAMLCKDYFVVRCAIMDGGLTAANINEDVFDTKLGKVVDEVMLTVAFTNE